jgi:hypothetical protein
LFEQISSDPTKAYAEFKKKRELEMLIQINDLRYWAEIEGPGNKRVKAKANDYINTL